MPAPLFNQTAPALSVSTWVQGGPYSLADLLGQVVLIEVFQVNCPGCFTHALPNAIACQQQYQQHGLVVLGIATAFEDFELNTLHNLQQLVHDGTVIGETQRVLQQQGILLAGCLPYRIAFPVAMDTLHANLDPVTDETVRSFLAQKLPDFTHYTATHQAQVYQQVHHYLSQLRYRAETFERYALQGTPSQLLIDKQGRLRASRFGSYPELDQDIRALLQE